MILFVSFVFLSGIITSLRYMNFYPFFTDQAYELITNTQGVTSGGAVMSTVFNALNYLSGLAFFVILVNTVKSKKFYKKILFTLSASTLLALVFGLIQHTVNIKLGNNPISSFQALPNATFKDAMSFSAYIAIFTPLALGLFFSFKGKKRFLFLLIVIISFYMVFFTGSKISLLSLIFSVLIFILLSSRNLRGLIKTKPIAPKQFRWILFLFVVVIIAVVLISFVFNDSIFKDITSARTISRFERISDNFKYRTQGLWKLAVFMVRDYPLAGVGIGGYIIEAANYSYKYNVPIEPESAENYFLQVSSELGLAGLLLILWIFWEIFKKTKQAYIKFPSDDKDRFILAGAIAGIVAFFINSQFHSYIGSYEIKYTFWLLVSLIFSFSVSTKETDKTSKSRGNFKIFGIIFIVILSISHLWNSTHSLSLKNRTEQFDLIQKFGFYPGEETANGRNFRWTGANAGQTIKIESPLIKIPLLATHPDIIANPLKVKIYLVKDFFKQKILLDEVHITKNIWKTYEYSIPEEVNQEVILLFRISRTWNPQKTLDVEDPRDLGIGIGEIEFTK